MIWKVKKFSELTTDEFHDILQLRINTFVVEQNCPYPELDDKDRKAYHLYAMTLEGRVVAYTRIFSPGDYYEQPAIGRVVVDPDHRGEGLGYELMKKSVDQVEKLFGKKDIRIGAQKYLRKFYESLGFESTGEEYIEDGIPHVYMVKKA
jgi:ElaA protein